MSNRTSQTAVLLACSLLAACGGSSGSSGGGTTEGLQPPAQLTLVEPLDSGSGTIPPSSGFDAPPDSDYERDTAYVQVYDPAVRPLQNVNSILCFMGLTGANLLVNEGAFLAQIDPTLCEEGEDQNSLGSDSGQSTGATQYELWTVQSTRSSNTSPQFSSIWVPDRNSDNSVDEEIRVRVRLDEAPSGTNPFGSWEMDYAGVLVSAPNVLDPEFLGTLETVPAGVGEIGFTFFEESGDVDVVQDPGEFAFRLQVSVRASEDQTSGYARIVETDRYHDGTSDSGQLTSEYLVAFDETHFLRSINGGDENLYSREEFDERVWSYNLYHADGTDAGERVALNSGFGFRTAEGVYGYAGYHGVWTPQGTELQDGDSVFRDVYDEPSELVEYTVTRGGGKLVRFAREDVSLDGVQGDPFQWWEYDPMEETNTQYLITWDGAEWVRTHSVDPETFELTEIVPPTVIDTMSYGYLSMWSDGLGGPASWTVDDPLVVTYYSRTVENADSDLFQQGDAILYGLVDCLGAELTATDVEAGDVYLPPAPDVMSPYVYRFQEEFAKDGDYDATIERCHRSIGHAMYYTSITIMLGFSILALSNFVPTIYFGLLTGLAMAMALVANLSLLPLLFSRLRVLGRPD